MALSFQAVSWVNKDISENDEDDEDDYDRQFKIYIFGRDNNGKSVCLKTSYNPYFYVEVPETWKNSNAIYLIKSIKQKLGKFKEHLISYKIEKHKKYYGFTNHKEFNFLKIIFKSKIAWSYSKKALSNNINVLGKMERYNTYESNLDPMIRFCHKRDVPFSCKIKVGKYNEIKYNKETLCDKEIEAENEEISQNYEDDAIAPIIQASFDIETYSPDGSFPDPNKDECSVMQVATTYKIYGEEKIHKQLICVGKCDKIEDVEVIECENEKELLNKWAKEIMGRQVDTITGYNIWKFDLHYMYVRALHSDAHDFFKISKFKNYESYIRDAHFSSSAYGDNHYKMIDMPGILQIDLLVIMQREHKLTSYKLDNVAEHFLKENKVDLPYKEMFKKLIGDSREVREVGVYCVQDANLPQRLIDKLTIIPNMVEMSKATWVPMNFLIERGQGIKVFSQLTRATMKEGMLVINLREEDKISNEYEGATVLEAKKGAYMEIPITGLDFASLYPTIMRAHNLDHSTMVMDEKYDNIENVEYKEVGKYKFAQNHEGIIPKMLKELANNRKAAKKVMAKCKEKGDKFGEALANGRQLAFKVSMNSIYGFCGANLGFLPCKPVAESTTAIGRNMISQTKELVEKWYPGSEVVYGDSVMGYTPIIIKKDGVIKIKRIDEMYEEKEWKEYGNLLKEGTNKEQKEIEEEVYTWTHKGWEKIKRVIRHKCNKKIYRVSSNKYIVDVTEDHSLIDENYKLIKPKECTETVRLLRSYPSTKELYNNIIEDPMVPNTNLTSGNFYIDCENQLEAQKYYLMLSYQNSNPRQSTIEIKELNDTKMLRIYVKDVKDMKDMKDMKNMKNVEREDLKVELLPVGDTDPLGIYVYDLETEAGSFQAGVGDLIVKNTDSVMVKFNVGKLKGKEAIKKSFELGEEAANRISETFKKPIELEFEKVYYPYLLYSKKRYAGLMYTKPEKPDYIDAKGIQLVRRDNAPFVKDISSKVLNKIMYEFDIDGAMCMVQEIAKDLLYNKIDIKDLIVSKSMKDNYKNENQPHLAVAKKIEERNPGSGPKSGERIPYVFVNTGNSKHKQFEKAEDPQYVIEKKLPIDVMYYLEHSLSSPLKSLFEIFINEPEKILFDDILEHYEKYKNKHVKISQFFNIV